MGGVGGVAASATDRGARGASINAGVWLRDLLDGGRDERGSLLANLQGALGGGGTGRADGATRGAAEDGAVGPRRAAAVVGGVGGVAASATDRGARGASINAGVWLCNLLDGHGDLLRHGHGVVLLGEGGVSPTGDVGAAEWGTESREAAVRGGRSARLDAASWRGTRRAAEGASAPAVLTVGDARDIGAPGPAAVGLSVAVSASVDECQVGQQELEDRHR